MENCKWRTGAVKLISDKVLEELKDNNDICVESATKSVLERMGEKVDREFLAACMVGFGSYIDSYISKYYRNGIVKGFLDEGISLTVSGRNWNDFKEKHQYGDKLEIISENMSYEEVLENIENSKMVLNVFPWFKNGSHERVASALINGAVCITDENLYTKKFLNNGENAILYDRNNPKMLADRIRYYTENIHEAKKIAEKGQLIGKKYMSVKNNVDILLEKLGLNK